MVKKVIHVIVGDFKLIPPSLYLYGSIAALIAASFIGTYVKGRTDGRQICNDRIESLIMESAEREQSAMRQANDAATQLEKAHAKIEIKYRTITKEVEKVVDRPVYTGKCLDDDGVRLANAALTRSRPAPPKPTHPLPEPPRAQ